MSETCKRCAEVILKEYFDRADEDRDGVIVDIRKVCELVASGKSVEEAVIEVAEFLPGSWLCRYLTIKQICNEIAKGRTPKEVIEEIKEKEPLRYRGCIAGEDIIYEIDLPDDEVLEAGVNEGDKGRERSEGSRIGW